MKTEATELDGGWIEDSERRPTDTPPPFHREIFFGDRLKLLGLTWEVCRTVWQTTPA